MFRASPRIDRPFERAKIARLKGRSSRRPLDNRYSHDHIVRTQYAHDRGWSMAAENPRADRAGTELVGIDEGQFLKTSWSRWRTSLAALGSRHRAARSGLHGQPFDPMRAYSCRRRYITKTQPSSPLRQPPTTSAASSPGFPVVFGASTLRVPLPPLLVHHRLSTSRIDRASVVIVRGHFRPRAVCRRTNRDPVTANN